MRERRSLQRGRARGRTHVWLRARVWSHVARPRAIARACLRGARGQRLIERPTPRRPPSSLARAGMMGVGMGFGGILCLKGYSDMITGSNKKPV